MQRLCRLRPSPSPPRLNGRVCVAGTEIYSSPEWFQFGCYRAEPVTVWQLGVVLYALLFLDAPFSTIAGIIRESVDIPRYLSVGKS